MWISLPTLLALASLAEGLPPRSHHVVHERRSDDASKWVKRDRLASGDLLPMRIGLTQSNLDKGYGMLMDVSDPRSKNYGKHYTQEEVIKAFAPSDATVKAVRRWLTSSGIHKDRITLSDNKGWLAFDATVDEAENLLNARFHEFEHTGLGKRAAAADEYSVPAHVKRHVDYITPGVQLGAFGKRKSRQPEPAAHKPGKRHEYFYTDSTQLYNNTVIENPSRGGDLGIDPAKLKHCDKKITPECIRALYQVPLPEYTTPNPDNTLGVYEFGDFYTQQDLDLFFKDYFPAIPAGTHPTPAFIDGAKAPYAKGTSSGESNLDFQLAYPLIHPQQTTLYQTDDQYWSTQVYPDGIFNNFLNAIDGSYCTYKYKDEKGNNPNYDAIYPNPKGYKGETQCGVYKPTNVISISYGMAEFWLPINYQQRQCHEFMKLGLQGHTVVLASGDTGVASKDGCAGDDGGIFVPDYPANCYAVTAVGATKLSKGASVHDREIVAEDRSWNFSSGGGFSNMFSRPDYQDALVSKYFEKHDPGYSWYNGADNLPSDASGGRYNRFGRGYPDVAALGDNIATYDQGERYTNGGTSASAPIFASLINRINEERLAVGKSPVGFLNPTLYQNPQMFNDIVEGNNAECDTIGFEAVPGWDPVSGLGSPNYPLLKKVFMDLP